MLSLALSGCSLRFDIPPQANQPAVVNIHPGEAIATSGSTEVIDPEPERKCFARARFFRGLVETPCADLAQEIRP